MKLFEFKVGQLVHLRESYWGREGSHLELPVCFWIDGKEENGPQTIYYMVPTHCPFLIIKLEDAYSAISDVATVLCREKIIKVDTRHLEMFTETSSV